MKPGQIISQFSLKDAGFALIRDIPDDRWGNILLLWTIAGLITGGTFMSVLGMADLVTTSISSDGSVMSVQTSQSGDTTIIGRLLGSGRTSIDRETETRDTLSSRLLARSDGPLIIGEYASVSQREREKPFTCVFGNETDESAQSETETTGILEHGRYESVLTMQPFERSTFTNGTGLVDLRHRLTGNGTVNGRTIASGNLSVSEHIRSDQG
ncbi:MAG: hypothetical protein V1862_08980 [Methanobacteriota archaeon]